MKKAVTRRERYGADAGDDNHLSSRSLAAVRGA